MPSRRARRRTQTTRLARRSALLVTSLLVLVGLATVFPQVAALPAAPPAEEESKRDLRLTLQVRLALQKDVALTGVTTVGVSVRSGVATLWGTAPSTSAARRALEVVSGVIGIIEVRNELQVCAPGDPLVEFLRQPTPRRPDGGADKLWFLANRPPSALLTVREDERSEARESKTEKRADPAPGVSLMPPVAVGAAPSPAANAASASLSQRIQRLQAQQPRFSSVQVEVVGGVVRLRGSVNRREDVFDLAQLISRLPGVERVILVEVRTLH